MKTSHGAGPESQGQRYAQGPAVPPGPPSTPPGGPSPYGPGPAQPPQTRPQPGPGESQIGNVTIFRTAQFFVHAVSGRRRTTSLQNASGNTSLLEQVRWISTERQRVLDSETRLLPQVELFNQLRREILIPWWFEGFVVLLGLLLAVGIHGLNVFAYPLYQQDEGLLMSNAWAVQHGMLQPYPYTYNQTPFGWILTAGWSTITGGFATFGNALNSGRALMLLFTFGSSLLVYLITARLSRSRSAGLLALILFSLTPLGITYQREVLLDNIGLFFLLLSLALVVGSESRLSSIVFAAIALGVAVMCKGLFFIFFPVVLYGVWLHTTAFQRKFALVVFSYIALSITSLFVLLALLKGEIFPTGFLPWDHHQHPSLWEGLVSQYQNALSMSDFTATWQTWMRNEMPLFVISGVALAINILGGLRNRLLWLPAFLLLTPWLFMVTTGIAFPIYFVMLLPLMALNIALAGNWLLRSTTQRLGFDLMRVLIIFIIIGMLIPYSVQHAQIVTNQTATNAQVSTLSWVRANVPEDATMIVNSDLYADLHEPGGSPARSFVHSQLYWNAIYDPDVRYTILHDDWRSIDYLVVDSSMMQEIRTHPSTMLLLDRALHHATLVQQFQANNGDPLATIQIYQVSHTE